MASLIVATTSLSLMADVRRPLERNKRELIRPAAGGRRPCYGRGSGERGTSRLVRRNRRAGDELFVVCRNDPDRRPERSEGADESVLGRAERRGLEDRVVVIVVLPESSDPGRIGRARGGKGSEANEHPSQRKYEDPKRHTGAQLNRDLGVLATPIEKRRSLA